MKTENIILTTILLVIFFSCEKNDPVNQSINKQNKNLLLQDFKEFNPTLEKTITNAERERLAGVPNNSVCYKDECNTSSNLGTLVIVGNDAFVTKTDTHPNGPGGESGWTTFYRIVDFETSYPTTYTYTVKWKDGSVPINLGHGNGMAYFRTPGADPTKIGSFYIALMRNDLLANQIVQVNATGEITKAYKARKGTSHKSIASITHCEYGNFIVGTKGENITEGDIIWKPFYTATKNDESSYFELDKKFYIPTTKTFNIGQDIHYNNGDLLVPVWDGKSIGEPATKRKNRIIEVEIGDINNIVNETYYNTKRWINLTVPASDADVFEFEGIYKNSTGDIIISANVTLNPATTTSDGIYKIITN